MAASTLDLPDHPDLHLQIPSIHDIVISSIDEFQIDILLMVVTEMELLAVIRHLKPLPKYGDVLRGTPYHDSYLLGVFGIYRCALVQCDMGGGGAGGATMVAQRALTYWKPKAVIMIGIAYGLKPGKQSYGDVLVSQQLASFDLQRVSGDEEKAIYLDSIQPSGPHLYPRFRPTDVFDWSFVGRKVVRGLILSGQVLVDSKTRAETLLRAYPRAIGGEMEGHGVSAAAFANQTEWVVVKAICDFAGLTGSKTKEAQPLAAAAAASLLFHVLKHHCLGGLGCSPVFHPVHAPPPHPIPSQTPPGSSSFDPIFLQHPKACSKTTEFFLVDPKKQYECEFQMSVKFHDPASGADFGSCYLLIIPFDDFQQFIPRDNPHGGYFYPSIHGLHVDVSNIATNPSSAYPCLTVDGIKRTAHFIFGPGAANNFKDGPGELPPHCRYIKGGVLVDVFSKVSTWTSKLRLHNFSLKET